MSFFFILIIPSDRGKSGTSRLSNQLSPQKNENKIDIAPDFNIRTLPRRSNMYMKMCV